MAQPLNYSSYLHLDRVLDAQFPCSSPEEHDEMLFIIIHQAYELWFKQLLHEFGKVKRNFSDNEAFEAIHTLKRCRTIMKTLVSQVDILETMTPMSFLSFRDYLETASGFQSWQFRQFEYALGYKRPALMSYHPEGSPQRTKLEETLRARSLMDHFYDFLEQNGVAIPEELRARPVEEGNVAHPEIQAGLLELYRSNPKLAILFELMTDFDEGMQEWRYRHVKLVERTVGDKPGTGGSLGVAFLKKSLFTPIFPDLWAIRNDL